MYAAPDRVTRRKKGKWVAKKRVLAPIRENRGEVRSLDLRAGPMAPQPSPMVVWRAPGHFTEPDCS